MKDLERIPEVLKAIEAIWIKRPDLRFFQLVTNLQFKLGDKSGDLYYFEDRDLLDELGGKHVN